MELVKELLAWYKEFPFPEYQPAGLDLPTSVADSENCENSVMTWVEESGYEYGSDERKERCAGVTADVAKHTAELLNGTV